MNGFGRAALQALVVVAFIAIVLTVLSLIVNPTSHEELDTRLERMESRVIVLCSALEVNCE